MLGWLRSDRATNLQALFDLLSKAHTRPGVGGQVHERQLLLQRVLSGSPEDGILLRSKRSAVEGDVIGYRDDLWNTPW
ncbi:g5408 [Coccomyxa elongata]